MSWQYRVMRRKVGQEVVYGIHEVYSGPRGWTEEPITPSGDTLDELREDYDAMGAAFYLPVLDFRTGKKVKALPDPAQKEEK